ncbi:MAG: murein transglycosylase A [Alphaproteobacteria bacterium]|nr:murein transglycosylase A [Alphaproteobacteria bacterium]
MKKLALVVCSLSLFGCETVPTTQAKVDDGYKLKPISFTQIAGWSMQDTQELNSFVSAFDKSCERIAKKNPEAGFGHEPEWGTFGQWQELCAKRPENTPDYNVVQWIEENFQPFKVTNKANDSVGLFTGYYEASLNGSNMQTARYNVPLREKPRDLVSVDLGLFRDDLRGKRIAGRVIDNKLKPYEDRAEITAQKMPLNVDKTIMWVDSPVDAFFLEIQGSGIVRMSDGSTQRVGYAGQNGHEYTAIGRTLIDMGELTKQNVSMQSIRTWLVANPEEGRHIMNSNRSYVFFRKLRTDGPVGAEGVTLTAGRSLAVDRGLYPYGLPVWIDVENPVEDAPNLQKLMVAQDTGGAIKGAVRGDVFWGYGANAEAMAGNMKSKGTMTVFIPK